MLRERPRCRRGVELPRRQNVRVGTPPLARRPRRAVGQEQLRDVQALERGARCPPPGTSVSVNCPRCQVEPGDARPVPSRVHRGDQVVPALSIEQRFIAHRARGDDPHHLTVHRALACGRIPDLLADHHGFAELYQLRQITFRRVVRNATHRNRLAGRLPASGQGDVEKLGGLLRVFIEDLVEVAHVVETFNWSGCWFFQAPVLLHHRRVPRERRGGMDGGHRRIIRAGSGAAIGAAGAAAAQCRSTLSDSPMQPFDLVPSRLELADLRRLWSEPMVISVDPAAKPAVDAAARMVDRVDRVGPRRSTASTPDSDSLRARGSTMPVSRNCSARSCCRTAPARARSSTMPSCVSSSRSRRPSLARGHSGVRWSVIEALVALANSGVSYRAFRRRARWAPRAIWRRSPTCRRS